MTKTMTLSRREGITAFSEPSKGVFILEGNMEGKKEIRGRFANGNRPANFRGWFITDRGYKEILMPNHPRCTQKGYVKEHRLIMEKHIRRFLEPSEVVHHKDGNTLNNSIENLELMDKRTHAKAHEEQLKSRVGRNKYSTPRYAKPHSKKWCKEHSKRMKLYYATRKALEGEGR